MLLLLLFLLIIIECRINGNKRYCAELEDEIRSDSDFNSCRTSSINACPSQCVDAMNKVGDIFSFLFDLFVYTLANWLSSKVQEYSRIIIIAIIIITGLPL